jgi:response regulator RpfG family c-di-GMP phosphodiesterase
MALKICILGQDVSEMHLCQLHLRVFLNAHIISANQVSEASIPHLVVSRDSNLNKYQALGDMISKRYKLPHIKIGENEDLTGVGLKHLTKTVASMFELTPKEMVSIKDKFFSFDITSLSEGLMTPCKVFRPFHQSSQVLLYPGQFFTNKVLASLKKEKVTTILVESKNRVMFVQSICEQLTHKIKSEQLSRKEDFKTTEQAEKVLRQFIQEIGVEEQTRKVVQHSIQSMRNQLRSIQTINELLVELHQKPLSYRHRHSILIAYIGAHILKNLGKNSSEHIDAITHAAFLHDIAIGQDQLLHLNSDKAVDRTALSFIDKQLVKNHAYLASETLKKHELIPRESLEIIKHHHGSLSGMGMKGLSDDLPLLSRVFVVAEEWTHLVLEHHYSTKRPFFNQALEILGQRIPNASYLSLFPALQGLNL